MTGLLRSLRVRYPFGVAAATPLNIGAAETLQVDRSAAIKEGLALLDQGLSYRVAAERVGVSYATLWRAQKQSERELAELAADTEAHQRIVAKARMACELGVERILRDLPTCKETYVAPWTWTAARLAGIAEGSQVESGVSDGVARLLTALGTRASIQGAIQVQIDPNTPKAGAGEPVRALLGDNT